MLTGCSGCKPYCERRQELKHGGPRFLISHTQGPNLLSFTNLIQQPLKNLNILSDQGVQSMSSSQHSGEIAPSPMELLMMKRMTGSLKLILGNHTLHLDGEIFFTLLILLWPQTNAAIALPLQKTPQAITHFPVHRLVSSSLLAH